MLRLVGAYITLKVSERPSVFCGIISEADPYTCFCFDEAFAFIVTKLSQGEEPCFEEESSKKVYSSPSQFYKKFEE